MLVAATEANALYMPKTYQVTSEPGYGFLFSMKDLNTSDQLDKLIETVCTLKIEGRKKDAQYVMTATDSIYIENA